MSAVEGFPLSEQQKRLWPPDPAAWNGCLLELDGCFGRDRIAPALKAVVGRHSALRIGFRQTPGLRFPVQNAEDDPCFGLAWKPSDATPDELIGALRGDTPALRCVCSERETGTWVAIAVQALCADRFSLGQIVEEFAAALEGGAGNKVALDYLRYAAWQQDAIKSPEGAECVAAWRSQAVSHITAWPDSGAHRVDYLDPGADQEFYAAAAAALRCRLIGDGEAVVGVESDGRGVDDLQGAVGAFAQVLPLHIAVAGSDSFHNVLDRVQHALREALDLQDYLPHNLPVPELVIRRSRPLNLPRGWRAVRFIQAPLGILETSLELRSRFDAVVREALRDPAAPVGALEVMAAGARRDRTAGPFRPVHEWFAETARLWGEHIAIATGAEAVTYRDLYARALEIAAALQARDIGPEDRVGVFGTASPETIAAILGVLCAGAAYVPFHPDAPAERVAKQAADTSIRLLLYDRVSPETVEACAIADLRTSAAWRPPDVEPGNLAYVIYTSGSTGAPKGVMIDQRNLLSSTEARREFYRDPVGAYLLLSPLAFDSSVAGLFWTLMDGGALILPGERYTGDAARLPELIARWQVSHLLCLPHVYRMLLEQSDARLASLKCAIVAGEVCTASLVELHRTALPECMLFNEYGPTEATVWCSVWQAPSAGPVPSPVPIGVAPAHATLAVMNAWMSAQPEGVSGELFTGGTGVARGYSGAPGLTASRFVPDPWGNGGRLYRTGDLVRRTSKGDLEFLGRRDNQVKISGMRIDLLEIESILLAHPDVREAVCVPVRVASGEVRQLVAFVVAASAAESSIRQFAAARLPAHMRPAQIRFVAEMPVTLFGKVDRQALERVAASDTGRAAVPRTPMEKTVFEVWAGALETRQFGIDDDFFRAGGDSIQAVIVVNRLQRRLGKRIPVSLLMQHRTVAAVAQELEGTADALEPVQPAGIAGPFPLTHAQERVWLLLRLEPRSTAYHIAASLRLRGPLRLQFLAAALRQLQERHEVFRTRIVDDAGEPKQYVESGKPRRPGCVDLQSLLPPARDRLARRVCEQLARRSFDLASGEMLRLALVRLDEGEHILAMAMHHIAADGWSLGILARELGLLYDAASWGVPAGLPPLALRYVDHAVRQRQEDRRAPALEYWRSHLAGATGSLTLFGRSRGAAAGGGSLPFAAPAALADAASGLARGRRVTLFAVLLAAFELALHNLSGEREFLIGTVLASRNQPELENLCGMFLNTLPLRASIDPAATAAGLIEAAQREIEQALEHADVDYQQVMHAARERGGGEFRVAIVMENAPMPPMRLRDLTIEVEPVNEGGSKFDLTLYALPAPDALAFVLRYDRALYSDSDMRFLRDHYLRVLEQIQEADRPAATITGTTAGEEEEALSVFLGAELT